MILMLEIAGLQNQGFTQNSISTKLTKNKKNHDRGKSVHQPRRDSKVY